MRSPWSAGLTGGLITQVIAAACANEAFKVATYCCQSMGVPSVAWAVQMAMNRTAQTGNGASFPVAARTERVSGHTLAGWGRGAGDGPNYTQFNGTDGLYVFTFECAPSPALPSPLPPALQ